MITANELKTKGIACLEENLADNPEAVITVRGKECFVVMKMENYHCLREVELEAALYEAQQDVAAGRFSKTALIHMWPSSSPNEPHLNLYRQL